MLEQKDCMFTLLVDLVIKTKGTWCLHRLIQLSSAESLRFFISFLYSPDILERISTGVIFTCSME